MNHMKGIIINMQKEINKQSVVVNGAAKEGVQTLTPYDEARQSLHKMSGEFKACLPANVSPEKFIRVTLTALQLNPSLLKLNRQSLLASAMKCAQDGLLPDGREAAFVPFGSNVQYMPMVAGICKKARNSGEISTMDAQVVYENDEYQSWTDETGPHFRHVKGRKGRGYPMFTYAYACTKDGGSYFEELDEDDINAVKNISKVQGGPWAGDFQDEMRRKTALRRLAKYRLPSSSDLDQVIRRDDEMYDLKLAATKQKTERLAGLLPQHFVEQLGKEEVTEAPAPGDFNEVPADMFLGQPNPHVIK